MRKRLVTVGVASFALGGSLLAAPPVLAQETSSNSATVAVAVDRPGDHPRKYGRHHHKKFKRHYYKRYRHYKRFRHHRDFKRFRHYKRYDYGYYSNRYKGHGRY